MDIYLAFVHDRHTGPDAVPFDTAEAATAYARSVAQEYASEPGDFVENPVPADWIYSATYSVEGDSVWVVRKTLNTP